MELLGSQRDDQLSVTRSVTRKKMHVNLAFVASLLATPVWAKPADIDIPDADTFAEVMAGVGLGAGYGHPRLPGRI